jgi:hypothetical protein
MRLVRCLVGALVLAAGLSFVGTPDAGAATSTVTFYGTMYTYPDELWAPANWMCGVDCDPGTGQFIVYSELAAGNHNWGDPMSHVGGDGTWEGFCGAGTADGRWYVDYEEFDVQWQWIGTTILLRGVSETGRNLSGQLQIVATNYTWPWPTACFLEPAYWFKLAGQLVISDADDPLPPTIPGGGAGPSASCTSNLVFDGTVGGVHLNALEQQPSSTTTWVCIRAETDGQGVGGLLEITTPSGQLPSVTVPTTDDDSDACWTTAGNEVPGAHPLVAVNAPLHLWVDTYRAGGETWVCAEAATTGVRLKLADPSTGSPGVPTVRWYPD